MILPFIVRNLAFLPKHKCHVWSMFSPDIARERKVAVSSIQSWPFLYVKIGINSAPKFCSPAVMVWETNWVCAVWHELFRVDGASQFKKTKFTSDLTGTKKKQYYDSHVSSFMLRHVHFQLKEILSRSHDILKSINLHIHFQYAAIFNLYGVT